MHFIIRHWFQACWSSESQHWDLRHTKVKRHLKMCQITNRMKFHHISPPVRWSSASLTLNAPNRCNVSMGTVGNKTTFRCFSSQSKCLCIQRNMFHPVLSPNTVGQLYFYRQFKTWPVLRALSVRCYNQLIMTITIIIMRFCLSQPQPQPQPQRQPHDNHHHDPHHWVGEQFALSRIIGGDTLTPSTSKSEHSSSSLHRQYNHHFHHHHSGLWKPGPLGGESLLRGP